jgi:GYF domain 2
MIAEWFYTKLGQRVGPVSFEVLQQMAAQGKLRPTDEVHKTGWPQWVPAGSISGLFAALAPTGVAALRIDPSSGWASKTADLGDYDAPPTAVSSLRGQRLLVAGIGAGVLLFAMSVGVVVAVVGKVAKPCPERAWNIPVGQHRYWVIDFNAGDDVWIKVTSELDSDVDLFVFTDGVKMKAWEESYNIDMNVDFCLAYDNSLSKDCYVRFKAPHTGAYYVVVANRYSFDQRHRNRANSGKLTFHPVR